MNRSYSAPRKSASPIGLTTSVVMAAVLACGPTFAAPINLVTNGSFEENSFFIERSEFPRLDDVNGSAPTGWTRDAGTLAEYMTRTPAYLGEIGRAHV